MTKRRASRFSGKSKKTQQDGIELEITPAKRRAGALNIDDDPEERVQELEYRLARVREWLENVEDSSGGMDKKNVILPRNELLLLRGILDDVVDLNEYDVDEDDEE